jgi:hypothetical protein
MVLSAEPDHRQGQHQHNSHKNNRPKICLLLCEGLQMTIPQLLHVYAIRDFILASV